jgi:uncharacterized integral membrane protein
MVVLIMKKRRLGNLCIANSEGKNPRRKSGSRPTVTSVKDAILVLLLIMLLLCLMVLMINVEVRLPPHLPLRLHLPLHLVALRPDERVALPLHLVAAEIEVEMMLTVARPSWRCCRRWRRRR